MNYKFLRFSGMVVLLSLFLVGNVSAQPYISTITVQGSFSNFYPVTFKDSSAWVNNVPSQLTIGRSNVHENSSWRGSVMATFNFHVTAWGNGANYIDAHIHQDYAADPDSSMIAGWQDVSVTNGTYNIVIWLRGGGTTFQLQSNYNLEPVIYDGVQNPLPYQIPSGATLTYKTVADPYVNDTGPIYANNAYFIGSGNSYFAGTVSIGTTAPKGYSLAVNGSAVFTQAVVKPNSMWPDFVFDSTYRPMPLDHLANYVEVNKHLPGVPSAAQIGQNGLDLGEIEKLHMQKIEELTLYVIDADKRASRNEALIAQLQAQLKAQQEEIDRLKAQSQAHP